MTHACVWHDSWVTWLTVTQCDRQCICSHLNGSRESHEWVMLHIRMSHGTHTHESCHTCGCGTWHIWMSHVTRKNESCHTYKWVMSLCISHVAHMTKSCGTYGLVTWHTWMSHVPCTNESRHTHDQSCRIWSSHDTRMNKPCHTTNESYHTYEFVLPHRNQSQHTVVLFTQMNVSYK